MGVAANNDGFVNFLQLLHQGQNGPNQVSDIRKGQQRILHEVLILGHDFNMLLTELGIGSNECSESYDSELRRYNRFKHSKTRIVESWLQAFSVCLNQLILTMSIYTRSSFDT